VVRSTAVRHDRLRLWPVAICGLLTLVAGCHGDPPAAAGRRPAAAERPAASADEAWPLLQRERRTTSSEIAVANLQGEIESLEARLKVAPNDVGAAAALIDALNTRALCLGLLADYTRAAEVAEQVVRLAPEQAKSYLLRARSRATLHRFEDALDDVREAESRGAPVDAVTLLRANFLTEIGEREAALKLLEGQPKAEDSVLSLGAVATLHAGRGEFGEAERFFRRAVREYRDVSPFPVVWIYTQQAAALEKQGRVDRAREFYQAALERFPSFVPALSKLADLETANGGPDRAVELLRAASAVSDDPDHLSRLAALLRAQGKEDEAIRLRDEAQRRFDALVAEHPEAFSFHASEFWLGVGGDAARGLELARLNLKTRRRPEDQALVARAEEAVRKQAQR
jgi:tetratricopeptide (TPR) repeat protein